MSSKNSEQKEEGLLADYPPLLTVKQVAEIFQVTPLTIKRWGKRGILPPIRINSRGDRRYTKKQVLWLIGQRQENPIEPSVNRNISEAQTDTQKEKVVEEKPRAQEPSEQTPEKSDRDHGHAF